MLKRNFTLLTIICFLSTALVPASAFAVQDTIPAAKTKLDSLQRPGPNPAYIPDSRMEQHQKWMDGEEQFPAKPRSMWQIGVHGGMLRLSSDVKSEMGYGYGLSLRKGLGYATSLRLRYLRGKAYGLNWQPTSNIASNPALNGVYDPNVDYWNEGSSSGFVYHNYQMQMDELSMDLMFNFNNIKFHKRRDIFSAYVFAGLGAMIYDTKINQLDANGNRYDYESIPLKSGNINDKKAQEHALKDILDETHESQGEVDMGRVRFRGEEPLRAVVSAGLGGTFKLSKRVHVSLEHKIGFTNDDLLDGQRWDESLDVFGRNTLSGGKDMTHYTSLHLGFNLGKNSEEPDWMVNPLEYVYDYVAYLDEKTDFSDDDDDGVPNLWDEEPDSPEGAVVDTKGRTKDSDGDGCPDHEDPEPFSTTQFPIVECKNVYPFLDSAQVVDLIKEHSVGAVYLPTIHFETDKSKILAQYYDDLKYIGTLMSQNKSITMDVTGHADYRYTEEYNMALSQRRAESAVNFLAENYGIDKSRFNIKYKGESDPLIKNARTASELYMNRRVEFEIASK